MHKMKTGVCITGAGGYTGRRLTDALSLDEKCRVFGVYRLLPEKLPRTITPIEADLVKKNWVCRLPKNIDVIIHLAQSSRYKDMPAGANDLFNINIKSTFQLLEWARLNKVKRFIFASTGSVYKQKESLLSEEDPCIPDSMYSASKFCAECLVRQYSSFFETIICRLFFIYGPGQEKRLIPDILNRLIKGREILLAKAEGVRFTPLYIDDCVKILRKLIYFKTPKRELTINVAGSEIIDLRQTVSIAAKLMGLRPDIKITEEKIVSLCANTSFLNKIYVPKVSVKEGLRFCIEKLLENSSDTREGTCHQRG